MPAQLYKQIDRTHKQFFEADATPTFTVIVNGSGIVADDAAASRVFVRFRDDAGVTRGSTSVAVRTIEQDGSPQNGPEA